MRGTNFILLIFANLAFSYGKILLDEMCCAEDSFVTGTFESCQTQGVNGGPTYVASDGSISNLIFWMWEESTNGTLMVDCGSESCDAMCLAGDNDQGMCSGDASYCESLGCTTNSYSMCNCRSTRGSYAPFGFFGAITRPVKSIWCTPWYTNAPISKRDLGVVVDPSFYVLSSSVFYTLVFPTNGTRFVTAVSQDRAIDVVSNDSTLTLKIADVCVSKEIVTFYSLVRGGNTWAQQLECPEFALDKCHDWSYLNPYDYLRWECLSTFGRAVIVVVFMYCIMMMMAVLGWFTWALKPAYIGWGVIVSVGRHFCGKKKRVTATAFVAFLTLCGAVNPYSTTCSGGSSFSASDLLCVTANGTRTCSASPVLSMTIPFIGSSYCYTFNSTDGIEGMMYVEYQGLFAYTQNNLLYYTSNWEMVAGMVPRCRGGGQCTSDTSCSNVLPSDTNPGMEMPFTATQYTGVGSCTSIDGCAANRCFLCASGCFFNRFAYKPTGQPYSVYDIASITYQPIVQITVVSSKGSVMNQDLVTGLSPVTLSGNVSALVQLTGLFNPVSSFFNGVKVLVSADANNAYVTAAADPGFTSSNKVGDIQSSTPTFGTNQGDFKIPIGGVTLTIADQMGRYTYAPPGLETMTSVTPPLPSLFGGSVWGWNQQNRRLQAPIRTGSSVSMSMSFTRPFNFTRQVTQICPKLLSLSGYGGCSQCASNSFLNVTATSLCSSGTAFVMFCSNDASGQNSCLRTFQELTPSLSLNGTAQSYKIYFVTALLVDSGFICLSSPYSTMSCIPWSGRFPTNVNIGNYTLGSVSDGSLSIGGVSFNLGSFGGFLSSIGSLWDSGILNKVYVILIVALVVASVIGIAYFTYYERQKTHAAKIIPILSPQAERKNTWTVNTLNTSMSRSRRSEIVERKSPKTLR